MSASKKPKAAKKQTKTPPPEPTPQQRLEFELATITEVMKQIHHVLVEIERHLNHQALPQIVRSIPMSNRPQYLNGRWKNRDGTDYHPKDEKPGVLAELQERYQAHLNETTEWSQSVTGRNTDPQ